MWTLASVAATRRNGLPKVCVCVCLSVCLSVSVSVCARVWCVCVCVRVPFGVDAFATIFVHRLHACLFRAFLPRLLAVGLRWIAAALLPRAATSDPGYLGLGYRRGDARLWRLICACGVCARAQCA